MPFEGHLARRRLGVADDQPGQGGLARPGRTDDRGQRAGTSREADVVKQLLAALDDEVDALHFEAADAGGSRRFDQRAVLDDQVDVTDGDGVAFAQRRLLHLDTIDEGAVDGVQVLDLQVAGSG